MENKGKQSGTSSINDYDDDNAAAEDEDDDDPFAVEIQPSKKRKRGITKRSSGNGKSGASNAMKTTARSVDVPTFHEDPIINDSENHDEDIRASDIEATNTDFENQDIIADDVASNSENENQNASSSDDNGREILDSCSAFLKNLEERYLGNLIFSKIKRDKTHATRLELLFETFTTSFEPSSNGEVVRLQNQFILLRNTLAMPQIARTTISLPSEESIFDLLKNKFNKPSSWEEIGERFTGFPAFICENYISFELYDPEMEASLFKDSFGRYVLVWNKESETEEAIAIEIINVEERECCSNVDEFCKFYSTYNIEVDDVVDRADASSELTVGQTLHVTEMPPDKITDTVGEAVGPPLANGKNIQTDPKAPTDGIDPISETETTMRNEIKLLALGVGPDLDVDKDRVNKWIASFENSEARLVVTSAKDSGKK